MAKSGQLPRRRLAMSRRHCLVRVEIRRAGFKIQRLRHSCIAGRGESSQRANAGIRIFWIVRERRGYRCEEARCAQFGKSSASPRGLLAWPERQPDADRRQCPSGSFSAAWIASAASVRFRHMPIAPPAASGRVENPRFEQGI